MTFLYPGFTPLPTSGPPTGPDLGSSWLARLIARIAKLLGFVGKRQ